ncbi:MAG: FtsQ-type POTRA domain-containing protein [Chloroflexi bacterium]|jgi:cell division protein FtsQ|nr:FtsQ-type POTRA domain-containing protein [Anaerolineaceae bacterium]NMB88066.1 FtsQ-type POTRA domain-containing protein [Chloroflexota bacterium]
MKDSSGVGQSRSEQVRQRRTQNGRERATHAANKIRYAADAPTILVRGNVGTPVIQRAQSHPRRQYTIPLGSPGAEMLLPAVPNVRVGWRLFSGFMTVALGIVMYFFYNMPFFQISAPEITGLERVNAGDIEQVIDVNHTWVVLADPQAIQASLETAFPELTDIQVKVGLPASLAISVKERQPVLAWQYQDETVWIDAEGVIFPPRGEGVALLTVQSSTPPPLQPVIEEETAGEPGQSGETVESADSAEPATNDWKQGLVDLSLINAAIKLNEKLPSNNILVYNEQDGFGWNDSRGWNVYIGATLDDLDVKLAMYATIVDQLTQQGLQPKMISVEFMHAPFYRME